LLNNMDNQDNLSTGEQVNLEDQWQKIFSTSVSGTGEEELLRIASTYSRQLTTKQIKAMAYLELRAIDFKVNGRSAIAEKLLKFKSTWLELKQYNNSDVFVMKALEHISLRKFIGENTLKINVEK